MNTLTIGHLPFQKIPASVRDCLLKTAGKSCTCVFNSLPMEIDAVDPHRYDVIFIRSETDRWEWLAALLRLNRLDPRIPVILLVPEGTLKDDSRVMQAKSSIIFIDNPAGIEPVLAKRIVRDPKPSELVLFVDDDENILNAYRNSFFRMPWKIITASSARTALDIISKKTIDLVVTDIKMPGMNGFEMIEEIRKLDASLPIIVCSGYQGLREASDMYFYKISFFIQKPAEMRMLDRKIREVLSLPVPA